MSAPLVSVVIPAHNAERFLGEAIESVLAQTYSPVETIVVDDGSTDATVTIAERCDGVKLLRRENRGAAAARNAGVAASRGEILAFLDADDAFLPHKLAFQTSELCARDSACCVLASQELVVEEGAELPFGAPGTEDFALPPELLEEEFPYIYTMSMVLTRALFEELGGFDERLSYTEDVDFLFRLMEAGIEISRHSEIVVRRRVHPGNMTQDHEAAQRALLRTFKARVDRHRARQQGSGERRGND